MVLTVVMYTHQLHYSLYSLFVFTQFLFCLLCFFVVVLK